MTIKLPAGETPSKGFYILLKIYKNPVRWKPEIEEWIADAYFKKTIESPYYDKIEQIRLKPLFNRLSTQWSNMDYNNCSEKLLNKVIQIKKIDVIDVVDYKTYSIEWIVVEEFEKNELIRMFPSYYPLPVAVDPLLSKFGKTISLDQISGNFGDEFDDCE